MGGWVLYCLILLQLGHFISSEYHATRRDVTNPITTIPTIVNPDSTPDSATPATMTPAVMTPTTGGSWCVASQSAAQTALQVALDYACGYGGADCSAIQPSGSCYNPNTIRDHASYAFNSFYRKNPIPTSCNFGGTAVITSNNPSTGSCQYPSTSTSSSVLNTTNSSGSTVFGSVPTTPPSSTAAAKFKNAAPIFIMAWLIIIILLG